MDTDTGDVLAMASVQRNDDDVVDAGDTFLDETTTDAAGAYDFPVDTAVTGTAYLVAVDSRSASEMISVPRRSLADSG